MHLARSCAVLSRLTCTSLTAVRPARAEKKSVIRCHLMIKQQRQEQRTLRSLPELLSLAQSSGECPGSRMTFCLRFGCFVAAAMSRCGPLRDGNSGTGSVWSTSNLPISDKSAEPQATTYCLYSVTSFLGPFVLKLPRHLGSCKRENVCKWADRSLKFQDSLQSYFCCNHRFCTLTFHAAALILCCKRIPNEYIV